uniref:hypothetical protein n=1 Tax=Aquisphaera insulae TaxID=2712864 RepID=UPI0013ED5BA7
MEVTYRVSRIHRFIGLVGFVFGTTLAILGPFAAFADKQERLPIRAAWFSGGVGLFFAALGGMLILMSYRRKLAIRGSGLEIIGVFRNRELDLGDVIRAKWLPRGLVLRDDSTRLSIEFGEWEWTVGDCDAFIGLVRSMVDPEVQSGWDLFAYKRGYGLPRRPPGQVDKDEVLITRRRWAFYCLPLVILASLGGVVAWRIAGHPRFLVAPVLPLFLWGGLHFFTPAEGKAVTKLRRRSDSHAMRFPIFALLWGMFGVPAAIAIPRLFTRHETLAEITFVVLWLAVLLYEAAQQDRRNAR